MNRPEFDFENRGVTMINIFSVKPENQDKLLAALTHEADTVMRHLAGYRHSVIHKSADGTRLVNYTVWESAAAFEASHEDPSYLRLRKENGPLIEGVDQHLFRIEFALDRDGPVR